MSLFSVTFLHCIVVRLWFYVVFCTFSLKFCMCDGSVDISIHNKATSVVMTCRHNWFSQFMSVNYLWSIFFGHPFPEQTAAQGCHISRSSVVAWRLISFNMPLNSTLDKLKLLTYANIIILTVFASIYSQFFAVFLGYRDTSEVFWHCASCVCNVCAKDGISFRCFWIWKPVSYSYLCSVTA